MKLLLQGNRLPCRRKLSKQQKSYAYDYARIRISHG